MKRVLVVVLLLGSFAASAQSSELENPGTVSAIQKRPYSMSFEFNPVVVGTLPLDAFYKSYYLAGGVVVHFNDYLAWQVGRGAYSFNVSTGLRDLLERTFSVLPTANDEINWFVGSDVMFKPFFGKTAVLNTWVLNYEAYFLVGAALFKYTVGGFQPGVNLGGGIRLFHTRYVSYRLDVTDTLVISNRLKVSNVLAVQLMLGLNFGSSE